MTQEKWIVEIEKSTHYIWATSIENAIEQAIELANTKAYKLKQVEPSKEPVTRTYPSCIDQEVIDALTPQELCRVVDRINEELNNRKVRTVTIPNYSNLIEESTHERIEMDR